jgi:hypothetical protein
MSASATVDSAVNTDALHSHRPPRWIFRVALVALVAIAFANSLGAGLIFDNKVILLEDTRIRAFTSTNIGLILGRSYWWPYIETSLYRPVTTLSYLFNYAVLGNGTNPAGYHIVNLLLHTVNTLLLFALGERLTGRRGLAFAAAALWCTHPLLTEAVTNVVGRADLLASSGVLAALWCHLRAADDEKRRWLWRAGMAAAALLGMFSKESAVAVVVIIPLYDLLLGRRERTRREIAPGWLALAPGVVLLLIARTTVLNGVSVPPVPFVDNPIVLAGFWSGRLTALAVLARYLSLVAWPVGLSCDYSFPQIPIASGTPGDWLAWAVVALATAGTAWALRRAHVVGFAVIAGFLVLLPAANLLFASGTIMAERLMYLPSFGVVAAAVAGAWVVGRRFRLPAAAGTIALTVVTALLVVGTIARNRVWHDEVSLWSDAVTASPRSFKTHGALAEALYQADPSRGNLPSVIAEKEQSLALLAGLPDPLLVTQPYREAATYYLERGDWLQQHDGNAGEARQAFEAAARWARIYTSSLDAARDDGRQPPTAQQLTEGQLLLSTATLKLNDPGAALEAAHRSRVSQPFNPVTYRAEAAALMDAQRGNEAAVALLTGFMVTGERSLRDAAIDLYRGGLDVQGCAVRTSASGAVLDPACDIVKRHICDASAGAMAVYAAAGRDSLAVNARDTALRQFGCSEALLRGSR